MWIVPEYEEKINGLSEDIVPGPRAFANRRRGAYCEVFCGWLICAFQPKGKHCRILKYIGFIGSLVRRKQRREDVVADVGFVEVEDNVHGGQ
jgi:hypothetical protein